MKKVGWVLVLVVLLVQSKVYCQNIDSLKNYLQKHIRYMAIARENDIAGEVVAKFDIDKNQKLVSIQLVKSLDKNCDDEVLAKLQDFSGQIVSIKPHSYSIAVNFILVRRKNDAGAKDTLNKAALKNVDTRDLLQIKIIGYPTYVGRREVVY